MNDSSLVKSASRALKLFQAFAEAGRALSLAELSRALDIPRSSCLALLRTLASHGYLYQVGAGGYYPTRMLFDMAEVISRNDPLLQRVLPAMTALRDRTMESVILGKLQDDRVLYLAVVESEQTIRYSARPGNTKPLHGTASGKALLSALGDRERHDLLERLPLPAITSRTITSARSMEEDLRAGVARGWQYVEGENVPEVIAIAVPVNLNGETYALVVTGPTHRMRGDVDRYARSLVETRDRLESGKTTDGKPLPS